MRSLSTKILLNITSYFSVAQFPRVRNVYRHFYHVGSKFSGDDVEHRLSELTRVGLALSLSPVTPLLDRQIVTKISGILPRDDLFV